MHGFVGIALAANKMISVQHEETLLLDILAPEYHARAKYKAFFTKVLMMEIVKTGQRDIMNHIHIIEQAHLRIPSSTRSGRAMNIGSFKLANKQAYMTIHVSEMVLSGELDQQQLNMPKKETHKCYYIYNEKTALKYQLEVLRARAVSHSIKEEWLKGQDKNPVATQENEHI
ncbi:hypothetical protein ACJX0J_036951 [Zea mays]